MAADMIYYASLGKKGKVKECLQNGVFVDAMNFKKETSLLFAAKNGHLPTVTLLLDAGANPNQLVFYLLHHTYSLGSYM